MMRFAWIILLIGICSSVTFAQSKITEGYFVSPVDHTIRLSGSFAELRSNHFHAGIDIKSKKGSVGDTIRAAAAGHISRIKMQRGGYGKVLYIDHPNGYTTVYAHMRTFSPKIQTYIEHEQRRLQSYEVDLYLDTDTLRLSQGESIGLLGNSGRSYGPHLHFEIRDTRSETPQNPYLHGIGPSDSKEPLLYAVAAQGFDNELYPIYQEVKYISKKKDSYRPEYTFSIPAWRAGMTIQAFDQMDGSSNKNGVYHMKMYVDSVLHYEAKMDSVAWDETKYINSFINYEDKKLKNRTMIQCYQQRGNPLSVYKTLVNRGFFKLFKNRPRHIRFEVVDYFGNTSEYQCRVKRKEMNNNGVSYPSFTKKIMYNQSYYFSLGCNNFYLPKGVTDNVLYLQFKEYTSDTKHTFQIGRSTQPLFKKIQITCPLQRVPDHLKEKAILVYLDGSYPTSFGGQLSGDSLHASIDRLGQYEIVIDTIPPTIQPLEINQKAISKGRLLFKLKDNYSTRGAAHDVKYDVYIDGVWTICPLKALGGILTVPLKNVEPGKHELIIIATDHSHNQKIWKSTFVR